MRNHAQVVECVLNGNKKSVTGRRHTTRQLCGVSLGERAALEEIVGVADVLTTTTEVIIRAKRFSACTVHKIEMST